MNRVASDKGTLDRLAIGLSGLCLAHCLAGVLLLTVLASAGGWLIDPLIHEIGLGVAILLGALAIGRGLALHRRPLPAIIAALGLGIMGYALTMPHGGSEAAVTIVGVAILALGHVLNWRALT